MNGRRKADMKMEEALPEPYDYSQGNVFRGKHHLEDIWRLAFFLKKSSTKLKMGIREGVGWTQVSRLYRQRTRPTASPTLRLSAADRQRVSRRDTKTGCR